MDYFIMHQDNRVTGAAQLLPSSLNVKAMTRRQIIEISRTRILYVREGGANRYPDYLEESGMLISEKLKRIMSKYQRDAVFKTAVLIERETNHQEIYYIAAPPMIDCASDRTIYDKAGEIKKFVLDEDKAGHTRIFCAEGYDNRIIVRLDVAESILRRDPYGVSFEKVSK